MPVFPLSYFILSFLFFLGSGKVGRGAREEERAVMARGRREGGGMFLRDICHEQIYFRDSRESISRRNLRKRNRAYLSLNLCALTAGRLAPALQGNHISPSKPTELPVD